jgi:hypothetical protein
MLNFCSIVAAILKMATDRNCSMSGINSGHHYLPTYQIMWVDNDRHFQDGHHNTAQIQHRFVRLQRPELVPDIEKFLPISIFKMAATMPF